MKHTLRLFFIVILGFQGLAQQELIEKYLDSNLYKNQFTGFYLFDPETKEVLVNYNGEKQFTPASNIKILTLYTAMKTLADSIPAFRYLIQGDELHIEGTGDPTFLNPKFKNNRVLDFIDSTKYKIVYHWNNFDDDRFGPGWSWDDYTKTFSPEKSAFPIYENMVTITKRKNNLITTPSILKEHVSTSHQRHPRELNENKFHLGTRYSLKTPFIVDVEIVQHTLSDVLGREVTLSDKPLPKEAKVFYSYPSDEVYKRMMKYSDNFLAEQLLILSSGVLSPQKLNSEIAIKHMLATELRGMPQSPKWVDGSGLSRYNLVSPASFVFVLNKLYLEFPKEKLYEIFAVGGQSGTLRNQYHSTPAYVYAKTGTLSNNYCLSGYVITNSGRTLIFSIMNNHFTASLTSVKKQTETLIRLVKEQY